jgi:hypothetical protein
MNCLLTRGSTFPYEPWPSLRQMTINLHYFSFASMPLSFCRVRYLQQRKSHDFMSDMLLNNTCAVGVEASRIIQIFLWSLKYGTYEYVSFSSGCRPSSTWGFVTKNADPHREIVLASRKERRSAAFTHTCLPTKTIFSVPMSCLLSAVRQITRSLTLWFCLRGSINGPWKHAKS